MGRIIHGIHLPLIILHSLSSIFHFFPISSLLPSSLFRDSRIQDRDRGGDRNRDREDRERERERDRGSSSSAVSRPGLGSTNSRDRPRDR